MRLFWKCLGCDKAAIRAITPLLREQMCNLLCRVHLSHMSWNERVETILLCYNDCIGMQQTVMGIFRRNFNR